MKLATLARHIRSRLSQTIALLGIVAGTLAPARASIAPMPVLEPFGAPVVDSMLVGPSLDLDGRSGKLRARLALPTDELMAQIASAAHVDPTSWTAGVHTVLLQDQPEFSLITLSSLSAKRGSVIEGYRVGYWPAEQRRARSAAYENPTGYIRVTPENQDTWISEHFRLRDFLTKDQTNVWPKVLVLREELIDKLELVIDDLNATGVPVRTVKVLSGFRTPQYNALGVGKGGRARDSRHQFGDAADIFVDNDGDGRMDDLNRDGRVNMKDVQVILAAVDRVDAAHPELTGGVGLYHTTHTHGPFAHIDTRGSRARWTA